jgi:8-oxo-dGTP pyrophosphatase MutT (NUDIX family)
MERVPFIAIARGFIFCGEKALLCRAKGYDFWFLPGGGIEDNEDAQVTLRRELVEENGIELEDVSYLTTVQNRFLDKGVFVNEIGLVFQARIPEGTVIQSLEDHMESGLFSRDEIAEMKILPPHLKHALIEVMDGKSIPAFIGLEA